MIKMLLVSAAQAAPACTHCGSCRAAVCIYESSDVTRAVWFFLLQAETHSDSPTPEDFASLCAAISAKQYKQLLQLDQLKLEQAAGRVFTGFSEGEIDFAPTFKVRAVLVVLVITMARACCWNALRSQAGVRITTDSEAGGTVRQVVIQ
jgi:hypothetical protein